MAVSIDFSRAPTSKESAKFESRLSRLDRLQQNGGIDRVYSAMRGQLPEAGLRIREGFSYREADPQVSASDRKALARELRPPATRLMTSRGSALRFILTLIALVQTERHAGSKAKLVDFGFEVRGHTSARGLTDLIASDATNSNTGGVFLNARDKRARSVRTALLALEEAGLVDVAGLPSERNRFEKFVLLNECGVEAVGDLEEYRVPTRAEPTFIMPPGLITNGWLHVLEDSEIAILLMVACAKEGWTENGLLVMSPEVRLKSYGIHRDVFSSARKTLEWFGLMKVEEIGRHGDGRAENGEQLAHRLGLLREGFEEPAAITVANALELQLARRQ